ncbi:DUF2391 family protein [Flammeovirga sp. SJP92]|uniref:DUF2391 family protein n=1 Tax=Flammeovirga sp. SJP92 TaxID=1775430 RepID=UPI00078740BF|nr:DUF2391 family protein [Flammeovirga sp. SJP92]KXX67634.1 hypothetical protein AVL50_26610 [Flammeovirga sp. SJP92]
MKLNIQGVNRKFHRINGKLYELFEILDEQGKILRTIDIPLKVEFRINDLLEIIVGASILAVPTAFTEEVWTMGDELPWLNTFLLSVISIVFIAGFVYYSSYKMRLKLFKKEFVIRILSTFILSVMIVGILLTVVNKCPWFLDFNLALKRTLIGAFPASLSATLTDQFGE